jgi:hypothetical protein
MPTGTYILVTEEPDNASGVIDGTAEGDIQPAGGALRYYVYIMPDGTFTVVYAVDNSGEVTVPEATPQG